MDTSAQSVCLCRAIGLLTSVHLFSIAALATPEVNCTSFNLCLASSAPIASSSNLLEFIESSMHYVSPPAAEVLVLLRSVSEGCGRHFL